MSKKAKGGKKSGGKKSGGKKSGKSKKNADPELASAQNFANVWAARVDIATKSRNDYRKAFQDLAQINQKVSDTLQGSEKNSIDFMIQLKKEDNRKNAEIVNLEAQLRDFDDVLIKEKSAIVEKYESIIGELETNNESKVKEIGVLQHELLKVKEFRQNKNKMQNEIRMFKNQLTATSRKHNISVGEISEKFQNEKKKLEKEAAAKISALANKAHNDAVAKMVDTTKQVYHDNIKLMDAMTKHTDENKGLEKENQELLGVCYLFIFSYFIVKINYSASFSTLIFFSSRFSEIS